MQEQSRMSLIQFDALRHPLKLLNRVQHINSSLLSPNTPVYFLPEFLLSVGKSRISSRNCAFFQCVYAAVGINSHVAVSQLYHHSVHIVSINEAMSSIHRKHSVISRCLFQIALSLYVIESSRWRDENGSLQPSKWQPHNYPSFCCLCWAPV